MEGERRRGGEKGGRRWREGVCVWEAVEGEGREGRSHEVCEVFTLRLKMWFSQNTGKNIKIKYQIVSRTRKMFGSADRVVRITNTNKRHRETRVRPQNRG